MKVRKNPMEITKDIRYVGVNDHKIDLFEGQYDVPNGMAYKTLPTNGSTTSRKPSESASPTTSSFSTWSPTTPRTSSTS